MYSFKVLLLLNVKTTDESEKREKWQYIREMVFRKTYSTHTPKGFDLINFDLISREIETRRDETSLTVKVGSLNIYQVSKLHTPPACLLELGRLEPPNS